ncbi:glycosyl transferase family 90-domain-containing protein [Mycena vitilis]|nr:glycosyl transferase family 90-domain-containing protein [Mycena vitilis]
MIARLAVDTLYARQSTTLAQASARYTLHTGRPPPASYPQWFRFAREKCCLIDEYHQIHRDFKPFYQLAAENPAYFQSRLTAASRKVCVITPGQSRRFSNLLPNMTFLMNGRDEPRIAFDYRAPGSWGRALVLNDSTPFMMEPHPTAEFFSHQSRCNVPLESKGFLSSANNDSGFLISSAKPGFTTDLYPILSMAKVSPCFSDILFPTEYYYDRSWWAPHFSHWRGMSNGGMIIGDNYHHFARFKLIDIARKHRDLMDVAITTFAETLCSEGCNRDAVITEYNITGNGQPREDVYGYKYAMDVDGTTFSGRFLGLLRSGSLVFKSTIFEEYFNDWVRPFEHFIPILPDLSDLLEKIEWANANPDEAHVIQQRGLEVARRVLTDDQNDCYFFHVLIEWAELQSHAGRESH